MQCHLGFRTHSLCVAFICESGRLGFNTEKYTFSKFIYDILINKYLCIYIYTSEKILGIWTIQIYFKYWKTEVFNSQNIINNHVLNKIHC